MIKTRPSTILVVDDDVITNRMIQAILTRAGFQIACAFDSAGALQLIHELQPDLVLLDVNLPDGSGFDVCLKMHQETGYAQIPVLFVSASEDIANKVRGFEVGGVDYIPKPFSGEEVVARVSTHLRLKQAYEKLAELQAERIQRLASAQETLMPLPAQLPDAHFEIALHQALKAGGDFYDVIPVGKHIVDYVVADASGHDLAASFWTASLKTLLSEYAHAATAPLDALIAINSALCRILPEGVFFTLIYARLNRQTKRLSLANAGQPPALVQSTASGLTQIIHQDSDVVGIFSDAAFSTTELKVNPKDRILLYSDGLIELDGPREIGLQRLIEAAARHQQNTLAEMVHATLKDTIGDKRAEDDVLLLGVEV
jgi:phosphoserine phosphatase RsbU/P